MKTINVGLFGCGTVGGGVVKVLHANGALIAQRTGFRLVLKKVIERELRKDRELPLDLKIVSRDPQELLDDPEIDIVVELIGGLTDARRFILAALKAGKHVVTANKALLAEHGKEIFDAAVEHQSDIYYEASVAGGIPIIKAMREGFVANRIEAIYGIVNGTCNYILTEMRERQSDFHDVLREAQKKGYAEANPSLDVDGIDSAHKLAILASIMSGQWIGLSDISVEGITSIAHEDIVFADALGYVIKLLAIAKEVEGELEVRVHPTLLEKNHPLANVSGVYNAIYLKGSPVGRTLFYGRGAGELPTASAVVSDLVDVARNVVNGTPNRIPPLSYAPKEKRIKPVERIETEYYLRFSVIDTPGVLAKIAGVLGGHKISIASVLQRERHEGKVVPVVILTHTASAKSMKQALSEIDRFDVVKKKTVVIPLERESEYVERSH